MANSIEIGKGVAPVVKYYAMIGGCAIVKVANGFLVESLTFTTSKAQHDLQSPIRFDASAYTEISKNAYEMIRHAYTTNLTELFNLAAKIIKEQYNAAE